MNGATQRWVAASVAAVGFLVIGAAPVFAGAEVTDNDRVYRNYTRETATVGEGEIHLEVRGLKEQDEGGTQLNLIGLRLRDRFPARRGQSLDGGSVELVGSYGFAKNAEVGVIVPGLIETVRFKDGGHETNSDVGDLLLYTKFQRSVAEHCNVGAGVELTIPNGPESKGLGTGELGVTPVVSTRYQRGRVAVGANVGYQLYTGDAKDVFVYGTEVVLRANETFALRTEIAGRVFSQAGTRFHDLAVLPGIDININKNLTIRPTGLAGATDPAHDWGIGLGVAVNFAAPQLAVAAAAPPPPPVPPAVVPPPAKEKLVLRGVNFDSNKAAIRADATPILDQAAETLKEHGTIAIAAEGHTDSVGTDEYNQQLSTRRAEAVRDYLATHGIERSRMTVAGFGESKPVASNDTADGRAQNRRVELRVENGAP